MMRRAIRTTTAIGNPMTGRTITVGHGGWLNCSAVTPTPLATMTARNEMIDSPTADATMYARMRSSR